MSNFRELRVCEERWRWCLSQVRSLHSIFDLTSPFHNGKTLEKEDDQDVGKGQRSTHTQIWGYEMAYRPIIHSSVQDVIKSVKTDRQRFDQAYASFLRTREQHFVSSLN